MSEKSTPPKPGVLSPEALDFAPGLLAIQESPPARLPRAVLYTVGLLFVLLMLWATFGKLEIIASAEGRLVPETYLKIVQPADAGIVKEILVKEGALVEKDQVLMRMDSRLAEADATSIGNELAMRALQLHRIDAELSGKPLRKKRDDPDDLFQQIEAQYRDHRQSYADMRAQAQEALTRSQREYDSASEVLTKLRQIIPILRQQTDSYADMGKDGYVPQMTVLDKQREYLEKSQDLRAQESTVAGLEAAVNQARKQLDQISSKYRSELQNERVETERQHSKLEQEFLKQEHRTGLLELKASQAGIVKDIATHTIGTVVSPGTVLLSIVPEGEPLVAEIMIKNEDVGFVHVEQKVQVKLAAYPFTKYGMLDGEVMRIQADSDTQSAGHGQAAGQGSGSQAPPSMAYKAIISLGKQILEAEDQKLKLVPGMQVVAEINQGSRTVMEYLLSPVSKTLYESGRER